MQSCNLTTIHVAVQHTADNISELLTEITDEWGITSKVHAVVTDNGANMVSAVLKLVGNIFLVSLTHSTSL